MGGAELPTQGPEPDPTNTGNLDAGLATSVCSTKAFSADEAEGIGGPP